MRSLRTHVFRRVTTAALTLALAAVGGLLMTRTTFPVAHERPWIGISHSDRIRVAQTGSTHHIPVAMEPTHEDTIIGAEFEGGPNDPEVIDEPISYGTPDAYCVVPAGEMGCEVPLHFVSASVREIVRIFVSSGDAVIDSDEGGDVFGWWDWGCTTEPDWTEVVEVTVVGLPTERPAGQTPPANADPDPATCTTQPSPSASPSFTSTPTPTPTPTTTDTATPTPTPTDTASPTPSPEPIQIVAPYAGRYRSQRCTTYVPASAQAPCEAAADAFPESGLVHAVAGVRPVEGNPATMADVDASAGVLHSARIGAGTIVAQVRVHQASIQAAAEPPSLGAPHGTVEVWLSTVGECADDTATFVLPIDGSGDIENMLVEVRLGYEGCESVTSVLVGVRASASTSPWSSGRVKAEATASVERLTIG